MAVEIRKSTCNRDCPDACGLVAEIEDGRLRSLKGDPEHPVTRGFLCFRTSRFPALLESPQRLRAPLVREGGSRSRPFREATLDEALGICAARLSAIRAESGPAAILHYRSGGSLGILKAIASRFFERFGPCTGTIGDICSGAGEEAQIQDFGVSDSNELVDLRNARRILLWGKNPLVSNVHLVPLLDECRAAGATLTLIDPIAHRTRLRVDRWLQPAPGGDLALALGAGRVLFETGGVDAEALARCDHVDGYRALCSSQSVAAWASLAGVGEDELRQLAAELADGPTAILVGWGMQRRRNGGAIVRALDALSAVTGNLFRSGGGCSFYFRRRSAFEIGQVSSGAVARVLREPLLGQDLLEAESPRIRAAWITAANPVCMLPDSARVAEALDRTEFVVSVDPFLTDTGRRADVVLPVPSFLEDSDLLGAYGHHWLGESRPLLDAPPGVVHELELYQRLAAKVGLAEAFAGSLDDWKRRLLSRVAGQGASLEALRAGAVRNPEAKSLLFGEGRVRTPNGKVQLLAAIDADQLSRAAPRERPLWLFSNSSADSQAAVWSRDPGPWLPVTVHPSAAPAGLADGELVVVESARGSLTARLRLDAAQRPDVALVPKGGHFDRGMSANALIDAVPTDLGLGAAYLDCHVGLRRP
jgi:anaerobic selenocysteine-containing dehydrogenase